MALADKRCVACTGETPKLTDAEITALLAQLDGWQVDSAGHLRKDHRLKDFAAAVQLVNAIAAVAEEEGHHPDIHLAWGKVGVELWTHANNGLTQSDFILAAKIDRVRDQGSAAEV